jgi:predicted  nucleic acid-binding Zn-ribbon protein
MVPEISHRCPSCGASIRDFDERAMFCPECGKALTPVSEERAESTAAPSSDAAVNPQVETVAFVADDEAKSTTSERGTARERTRERLHRASTAARGAIEDNVKRVEKIHHVSTVMFEEASYDPSLRFVLVALGLFLVFIILLVLSKVMG